MDQQTKAKLLASLSDEELMAEVDRRRELHLAKARALSLGPVSEAKSTAKSEAARLRWAKARAEGFSSLKDAAKAQKGK